MSTPASTTTAPTVEVVDPDYPVTPVPRHARKSFVSLAVVLLGFTVFTPTMLAGAQLGAAFSLSELVQVILLIKNHLEYVVISLKVLDLKFQF